jgi:hypothetical protein
MIFLKVRLLSDKLLTIFHNIGQYGKSFSLHETISVDMIRCLGLPDSDPLVRASEERIRILVRILQSSSKNNKKKPRFLLFCDFFMTFSQ